MEVGEGQTRHHLFARRKTWLPQSRAMWKSVGKACRWKHPPAPPVRMLFQDDRAAPAVLSFLRETRVGKMAKMAHPEEEVGEEREEEGEEGSPGPP